ncbi:hypothetical protein EGK14_21170 [Erwinia sp. 198]|nr:hypothetical protein EGK14_21170 [Erwinia sp. 198]
MPRLPPLQPEHTGRSGNLQLNGAVIASTADASLNKLDTGTLGFGDIHNHADYKVEHQSAGISTGGSVGGQFAGNMANGMLAGLNDSGSADSVTKAAVSEGTIVIRDKEKQTQDVADLSRDVANANPGLDVIFDKEKEQNRLKAAQLIGEIGAQAGDIARTQGQIAGMKAQQDPAALQAAREQLAASGKPYTEADISQRASPYLAEKIHELTTDANGKVNVQANLMAHAVLGAVTSYAAGNAALAGASGAVMGEYIAQQLYPGVKRKDLSEEQRQTISALGTLAAGLAGGLAGDSAGGAVTGAQAGKNAVENNYLSDTDVTSFTEKYANAKTDEERDQLVADLKKLDAEKQGKALTTAIPIREQKAELEKLKVLKASPDCNTQCQQLVTYSISELEPVANNTELHKNNLSKAVLAGVIFGLTVEKSTANNPISRLTREQQQLIERAEFTTTAKGIQNAFPRDLNEKVVWNQIRANPGSAGEPLKGMNKDARFPTSAGFQKMEAKQKLSNGSTITVHYQYNSITGKAYDMKVTTPQRSVNDPAKVIDSIKDAVK